MNLATLLAAIISAMLINNIILAQFLGICPFLGVSKKMEASVGMSAAVTFVMLLAALVTWPIYNFILVPAEIEFMATITFILIIASLVQLVEMFLKKYSSSLYKTLGVYLPLITTNCAILGVANNNVALQLKFGPSMATALGAALGFSLVIIAFTAMREKLEGKNIPVPFAGVPISLIIAAFMAIAFTGLAGLI
ncbi:MAG: RnfABCDGE type electron transport complex subunit A [Spiroplasma sp.]|nr:RnfABCDGE type electron transport complex subunit A [Mycoplasmatales bacterium]